MCNETRTRLEDTVILRIDHIGVVTAERPALAPFLDALGMSKIDYGVAEAYRTECEFWRADRVWGGPMIELVSPAGEGSALDGHLARNGPGLHHIAIAVDDITEELTRLRQAGFTPVDLVPCAGARSDMLVAFTYLPKPAGLLVELVQYGTVQPLSGPAGR
jgi:methylmalonyl-CoA/ethylmalonyl-CoA epimerase